MDTYTFTDDEGAEITIRRGDFPTSTSDETVFNVSMQRELLRLGGLDYEREIFVAELVGALKLDREEIDRGPKMVGNVVLEAVQRLAGRVEELESCLGQVHGWMDWHMPADWSNAQMRVRNDLVRLLGPSNSGPFEHEEPITTLEQRIAALELENERLRKRLEEAEAIVKQATSLQVVGPDGMEWMRAFLEGE